MAEDQLTCRHPLSQQTCRKEREESEKRYKNIPETD